MLRDVDKMVSGVFLIGVLLWIFKNNTSFNQFLSGTAGTAVNTISGIAHI